MRWRVSACSRCTGRRMSTPRASSRRWRRCSRAVVRRGACPSCGTARRRSASRRYCMPTLVAATSPRGSRRVRDKCSEADIKLDSAPCERLSIEHLRQARCSARPRPTDGVKTMISNAMTVDVEDYLHVSAFERHIRREDWDRLPCRVERNTDRILDLFAERRVQATFFMLGWVAERYPALVRRSVDEGHELASHGYGHVRVTEQTPPVFREDGIRNKKLLEDMGGTAVRGNRAASYSIGERNLWALDVLQEPGHVYSNSIYPIRHDLYGMPAAARDRRGRQALRVLFPSGGDRPRAAAPAGHRSLDALSPLRLSRAHGAPPVPAARRFSLGPHGPCLSRRPRRLRTDDMMLETASSFAGLHIKRLRSEDIARWDAFVAACPQASFFHRAGWAEVLERAFGHRSHFFYAERNGLIEGVLPLGHVRSRLFGNSLSSSPFCVYGGVAAQSEEAAAALEAAAIELARELKVDYLELRNRTSRHADWPGKRDLYVTFRKEIDADNEKNMLAIPRKQRAMVRKGIDAGLIGEIDPNVSRFYDAYSESVHNLGTPVFARRYFEILREVFGDDCEILTITQNGRLVASVMSFYFRDEVLPYYGGGTALAREVKGNDFMYW